MAYQKAPMLYIYKLSASTAGAALLIRTYAGMCEQYTSLLWDVEYYTVGSFEVYLPARSDTLELFQTGYLLVREDDAENHGVIESVSITYDSENGSYAAISGRFLPSLLERRVIYPTVSTVGLGITKVYGAFALAVLALNGAEHYSGNYSAIFGEDNAENYSVDSSRVIPGATLNTTYTNAWTRSISEDNTSGDMQVTDDNLMEWAYKIAERVGGTIKATLTSFDAQIAPNIKFTLSEGEDRRDSVIFSDTVNNLAALSYGESTADAVTAVYARFSIEEGTSYAILFPQSNVPTGFERYEATIELEDVDTTGYSAPEGAYLAAGASKYVGKLNSGTYAAEAEVVPDVQYTYGEDYNVGDIVTIQYSQLGISLAARLTGMIESFDQSGRTLTPTFSFLDDEEE